MASADGRGWRHAGGCGLRVNRQLRTSHGAPADYRLSAREQTLSKCNKVREEKLRSYIRDLRRERRSRDNLVGQERARSNYFFIALVGSLTASKVAISVL
jgi:hypothetical protein